MAKTAYYAIFESHLRYGLVVWGGTSKANLQRVLVLQKRAVRILTGLGPRDSCREAFKEQKILTVIDLYILETILFAVRQNPTRGNETHNHNTRTANNFTLPIHRLAMFEK
ncbi:hypothetical protein J6590_108241 [Homalodisca vitripennis]|nr:hypothetical protein J6590_108241 [Homalodisca vitripennis]